MQQTRGVSPAYRCPPASQKITRNKSRSIGLDFLISVGREEKTRVSLSNTLRIFFHQTRCPNRSIKTKHQVLQARFKISLLWLCPKALTETSSWPSHTEHSSTTNYSSSTKPLMYIYIKNLSTERSIGISKSSSISKVIFRPSLHSTLTFKRASSSHAQQRYHTRVVTLALDAGLLESPSPTPVTGKYLHHSAWNGLGCPHSSHQVILY